MLLLILFIVLLAFLIKKKRNVENVKQNIIDAARDEMEVVKTKKQFNKAWFKDFLKSEAFKNILASLVCVVLGLLIGFIVIIIVNAQNSPKAIMAILKGPLNAVKWKKSLAIVIFKSVPLLLCSLSIIFAYKCGLFNIGAPGQYVIGTMFALVAAHVFDAPWYVCLVLAAVGGALWGIIPGLFKAFLNVNEVITSIMFNWIGLHLLNYVAGPDMDLMYNILLAECKKLPVAAKLPTLGSEAFFDGSSFVTVAVPIAIVLVIALLIILYKTKFGYEIRATGFNKDAAKYAGMNYRRNIIVTMAISGALAGLAAATFYLTDYEIYSAVKQTSLPAMGFNGIAVAFLGCVNPVGAIFSSILITYIGVGGSYLDTTYYSSEIGNLISAIIIYLSAFSLIIKTIIGKISFKKKSKKALKEVKEVDK